MRDALAEKIPATWIPRIASPNFCASPSPHGLACLRRNVRLSTRLVLFSCLVNAAQNAPRNAFFTRPLLSWRQNGPAGHGGPTSLRDGRRAVSSHAGGGT